MTDQTIYEVYLGGDWRAVVDSLRELADKIEASSDVSLEQRYLMTTEQTVAFMEEVPAWQSEDNAYDAAVKAFAWSQGVDSGDVFTMSITTKDGTVYTYVPGRDHGGR